VDSWAKSENDGRKKEIAALDQFAHAENDARKTEIANLNNFARSENDGRKAEIAALNQRCDSEVAARDAEDKVSQHPPPGLPFPPTANTPTTSCLRVWRSSIRVWRSSVGSASASCKAGPSSILGSAP